ncbi:MAG TPA: NAD(P)/FAD-dependent oxidoreductase [Acidimicrobiales bacterium]|nr:NAD(P)/FAD-dependent oxidoreductase [Acidimicrobiales bacterium]
MGSIAEALGEVGLPAPMSELALRSWDAVVVGGGHNGLACAAYLARTGQSVLVLERSERLGGACTLERPFPDPRYVVSPCAYVVGLLDKVVIDELDLRRHGLQVFVADPNLWAPFEDGTSLAQWNDDARTQASLDALGLSPSDVAGYWAYEAVFDEMRQRLRTRGRDSWIGDSPTRDELEEMLGHDQWMVDILFEASIADVLDHYIVDQRLKDALYGQGVIGAYAGPRDWGTASVKLMHYQGDLEEQGPVWGYVRGGMGMVSFALAEAATEAGAVLACGAEVAEIVPGQGVRLDGGELVRAATVVCNADPKRALAMLAGSDAVPVAYRDRLEAWQVRSPVVKFNAALSRLPTFTAAAGESWPFRSMISVTPGLDAAQRAFEDCQAGIANVGYGEVYFQTGYDPSPAPEGRHLMSVFGQYAPYALAGGSWDDQRDAIGKQFVDLIGRFAPDIADCIEYAEVLGPPDVEERVGLTGGHIFQGETMPDQMWEHRLTARTPVPGLYLCGAATHPAGSVIALNGRNAAEAVLHDRLR